MWLYLLKRLLIMIPTLIGVLTLTFAVTQFIPGGPVDHALAQLDAESARTGTDSSAVALRESRMPGPELWRSFHSSEADRPGSDNLAGVKSPAVDALLDKLLNVSYDVTRELYKEINPAFLKVWNANPKNGALTLNQSHGGSSKQVLSVLNGLEADVVTMNQATDIDLLAKSGLVSADWRKAFANGAAPYSSTTVFLVRQGNPKQIKDWQDLIRPDVQVILANPKTSGNGRYAYLAAWGYAKKQTGSDEKAREFVKKVLAQVPVLDAGGRGATTTFTQRGIGDVLITFENEAFLVDKEISDAKFDVVYPSLSIRADSPVAIVNKVVDAKGSRAAAKAYLDYLYTPEAQEIIGKHYFRPYLPKAAAKFGGQFKPVKLFTVEEVFGGWDKAQAAHFADGGSFDQVYDKK